MSCTNRLRTLLAISTSLSLMILTACGTTTATKSTVHTDAATGVVVGPVSAPVVQTLCTDDGPVNWDPADLVRHPDGSNETLKNIKRHNAVWDAICSPPH